MKYDYLLGKKVKHKCENPHCTCTGTILKIYRRPGLTRKLRATLWWALIQWDIGAGYMQPVPLSRIELIEEEKEGHGKNKS